jgi:enoyl-[acyl-carrier protein] reductase II
MTLLDRLGVSYPIIQAGMSWASSDAALPIAVSNAGGLGVIAAGPMYPDALRETIVATRAGTDGSFAVNIPLYSKYAAAHLQTSLDEGVPVIVASQGGPGPHIGRFRDAGIAWLHVVTTTDHARKAEDAGVDGVIAVGTEAGGHPAPSGVSSLVLVRAAVRAVSIPVIGSGGVADGAGIAAMLCLGAVAAQLGTRFLLTRESNLHPAYKEAVRAAGIGDTMLIGGALPIRVVKNDFTAEARQAEQSGMSEPDLTALYASRSLRDAAVDGDVRWGKVEAGQSAGLIDDLPSAADVVRQLVVELQQACAGVAAHASQAERKR